jgi:elongation factor 3
MSKVTYQYPVNDKPTIYDVSLAISLASRVAVTGPNGAGKSTAIKCLTGEVVPLIGTVWKHPALRVAYVAQHAFHHLEEHLDWTPSEYIQWRYSTGEDREALVKANREITEEEAAQVAKKITINGVALVVEQLVSRRKFKTSYEYEVKWVGQPQDKNTWLSRVELEKMGFGKMVDALDAKEAAQAGLRMKPLTAAGIAKHLADVGLDQEFTLHSRMRGLSGGQKVKVVLGAAMWNNPHVLVLDEPTNYLDRDSLGALAGAIKTFGGGVVIISHNAEFCRHITSEQWNVDNGRLVISGELGTETKEKVTAAELGDEVVDAAGNVIKVEKVKTLSEKEKKKLEKQKNKEKKAKKKAGIECEDDSFSE